MDEKAFWELIESSRAESDGDVDALLEVLRERLAELPSERIVAFDRIFGVLHAGAYRWDLWAAAYVIQGGCSDDRFMDFRSGLIGLGRDVYYAALSDPESLAALPGEAEEIAVEELTYVASEAYEAATGEELPDRESSGPSEPIGEPWDEATVGQKYPKLAKRFGFE